MTSRKIAEEMIIDLLLSDHKEIEIPSLLKTAGIKPNSLSSVEKILKRLKIKYGVTTMFSLGIKLYEVRSKPKISKAPEMLEMLKILRNDYGNYIQNILQESHRMNRINEIDKLIKDSTTI